MNEVETSTVELFVIKYKSNKMHFLPSMFGYLAGHLIGAGIYPSLESFSPPLSLSSLSLVGGKSTSSTMMQAIQLKI